MKAECLKEKLEKAKITLRQHRDEAVKTIDAKEKSKEISEDEKFKSKAELQKIIDETNKKLEELYAKKEKELRS
jgi:ribosome recycling factor